LVRLTRAEHLADLSTAVARPPGPRPLRPTETMRFELAMRVERLTRTDDGTRAALALAASYARERTISIGFAGLRSVRQGAVGVLVREACLLVRPWGAEGRIELRCLRRPTRRILLDWLVVEDEVALVAAARRRLVLSPAVDEQARREAELFDLAPNRRRMLRLAARDGEHCVWCSAPLTHRSANATVDHVICRSEGGSDGIDNLVLSCATCNHRRSNAPADVWLARLADAGTPVDATAIAAAIARAERHRRIVRAHGLPQAA
jgi:hypothetical protein